VDDREMADLIEDAFEHIPRHQNCKRDGLLAAVRGGVIDFIDALAIADIILGEGENKVLDAMEECDRQRLKRLKSREYGPAGCENF
jgi:hypothetical protein